MVDKITSFKKKGKGKKGNFKKNSKQVAAHGKKPKSGPKPKTECFYDKGTGHQKRNCPKYLADKKDGKVKGIFDIHVIDVYLTNARSSAWVFDTGSVAHICNSKQGLHNIYLVPALSMNIISGSCLMRDGYSFKSDMHP